MAIPNQRSRWSFSLALTDDGREERLFLDARPRFWFESRDDNRIHTVRRGETLHSIATDEFAGYPGVGRPALWWWILADYNDIVDPSVVLDSGREIWVPSQSKVQDWFGDPDRVRRDL